MFHPSVDADVRFCQQQHAGYAAAFAEMVEVAEQNGGVGQMRGVLEGAL